jgi:hypothetical protein
VRYISIGTQCNAQRYPIRHAANVVLSMYYVAFHKVPGFLGTPRARHIKNLKPD